MLTFDDDGYRDDQPKISVDKSFTRNFKKWLIDDYSVPAEQDSILHMWVAISVPAATSLDELPDALLLRALGFLEPRALCRASATCKKLQRLCASDAVWQRWVDAERLPDYADQSARTQLSLKDVYRMSRVQTCSSCGHRFRPLFNVAECRGHKGVATTEPLALDLVKPVWSCCHQLVLPPRECTVLTEHRVESWSKRGRRAASIAGAIALTGASAATIVTAIVTAVL
eukprot:TRINITY_DN4812_c0_g1_i1.p1 TRINITY_DN4812_c0_g1~~TRINITY_DN4812_c0_g1_i1.p1  ORF type:complete len:228 (+),score=63.30 TRINITY_DN4812_c0_g1_i1:833-1516(+)